MNLLSWNKNHAFFGQHISELIEEFRKPSEGSMREFPLCYHPELYPSQWEQKKPKPCRTVGSCPVHNYICPICGLGVDSYPECECNWEVSK